MRGGGDGSAIVPRFQEGRAILCDTRPCVAKTTEIDSRQEVETRDNMPTGAKAQTMVGCFFWEVCVTSLLSFRLRLFFSFLFFLLLALSRGVGDGSAIIPSIL